MKGILFKPEMIQAIVERRKTVTRRLSGLEEINKEPDNWAHWAKLDGVFSFRPYRSRYPGENIDIKPRYQVGETVYIKEAWATELRYNNLRPSEIPHSAKIFYANDGVGEWPIDLSIGRLRSALPLPEVFARYFIKIKDVRAEILQEITIKDAIREGFCESQLPIAAFKDVWNSINKDYPWESNPWVFRYEFEFSS